MRVGLSVLSAQLAPSLGDVRGNLRQVIDTLTIAEARGADLLVTPELFLLGYPPEDLVLRPSVVAACAGALDEVAAHSRTGKTACVVGLPHERDGVLHNAIALVADGEVQALRFKHELPNYGVFDEKRLFSPGPLPEPVIFRGRSLGFPICEDIWCGDVLSCLADRGATFLLSCTSSPWRVGKASHRRHRLQTRCAEQALPCLVVNRVGGQDELVFDGASMAIGAGGEHVQQLKDFTPVLGMSRWEDSRTGLVCTEADMAALSEGSEEIYRAVMTGLADYVEGAGFEHVILGLSGGIDSALAAAIAVDALGADHVHTLMMPYRYTRPESIEDAALCARNLGVSHEVVALHEAIDMLAPLTGGLDGIAHQNLQARLRGVILMTRSNAHGAMVVTTGNKSELAVGYATLYGDMCGGFNPLKDIYKTQVIDLARWRNRHRPKGGRGPAAAAVIPERIIARPPSAELCAGQTDEDILPPYPVLDTILRKMIDERQSVQAIAEETGYRTDLIGTVERMLHASEYKRRQAAPGVRVGWADFGRGRRYPLTHRWQGG